METTNTQDVTTSSTVNGMTVEWFDHDDGIRLKVSGSFETIITERVTDDGIVYESDAYRVEQKTLKEALGLAARNAVQKSFLAEWSDRLPAENKSKDALIQSIQRENADLLAQIEALSGKKNPKGRKG